MAGIFFASRRRHTSLVSDWSSDVCSSDLSVLDALAADHRGGVAEHGVFGTPTFVFAGGAGAYVRLAESARENGRASCRERGGTAEGGGAVKAQQMKEDAGEGRDRTQRRRK